MRINLKVVPMPDAQVEIPVVQTLQSACADVRACFTHVDGVKTWTSANQIFEKEVVKYELERGPWFCLYPSERALIPTGLRFIIPHGFQIKLIPRSGVSLKKGVILINSPGTIDSDYTNEVMIPLYNASDVPFYIHHGDRLIQMEIRENTIQKTFFTFGTEEELQQHKEESDRDGGFGSTGI